MDNEKYRVIDGGVIAPSGFKAAGVAAEVKYKDRRDMAMIFSASPCAAAGVFTRNVVKAAPVKWDQRVVASGEPVHAVVVNSGIANACTGEEGLEACEMTARAAAEALDIKEENVIVASTGVIGMQLPMDRILAGISALSKQLTKARTGASFAAEAIITTDTHPKEYAVEFTLGGKVCRMGMMAKGSGMIHPNMGTMLAFVTTDACIYQSLLQKALSEVVEDTFNMISVDGDTSTNDSLIVMANGEADNPPIASEDGDYQTFKEALRQVCTNGAMMLAGDGEGATALFETRVVHAATKHDARVLAKSVICSSLTKAAIYGHDANWGRILCALGYAGVDFDPDNVDLVIHSEAGALLLFSKGEPQEYSEEEASAILSKPHVTALVDIHSGEEEARAWGCDLTYDYVRINADYRS